MLSTDDWCFMEAKHAIFPSLVTHSSPNHHKSRRNVTRKCCFTTSRRVSSPFLGTKLRGNVLFAVQPLSLEAPTLEQSTCARMRAYYKIFFSRVPTNVVTDDTPTSPHKSCKNSRNKKISKFTKSLYLFAAVYKERRKLKVHKIKVPIATFL